MKSEVAVVEVIQALNQENVPYMVTGSLATNIYGIARSTLDADLLLSATSDQISQLLGKLRPPLHVDPQMSFETITGTTRHIVKVARSKYTIELFYLQPDPHDRTRFERRKTGAPYGQPVWCPTPEDVIITKLRWSKQGKRTKDVDDVRNVIAVQGDTLDWEYIHRWCEEHGTRDLLEQIRRSLS